MSLYNKPICWEVPTIVQALVCIALLCHQPFSSLFGSDLVPVYGFSVPSSSTTTHKLSNLEQSQKEEGLNNPTTPIKATDQKNPTYKFSVPLNNTRPKPESFLETFQELWNDPRPISSVISSQDWPFVSTSPTSKTTSSSTKDSVHLTTPDIPYCIISDPFHITSKELQSETNDITRNEINHKALNETFQILLYPLGRFAGGAASSTCSKGENDWPPGPASAYLRYLPSQYGDEIDIAWKLRLRNDSHDENNDAVSGRDGKSTKTGKLLPISTSGGLPISNDTWSAAMTFCTEYEAVESVGRATDWGSSIWNARDVCEALHPTSAEGGKLELGNLVAEVEMMVFDVRKGESSFSWPFFNKGGIGAVARAATGSVAEERSTREFRVGEVIVPRDISQHASKIQALKSQFIYPGIDYRIMTMTDQQQNPIFSTHCLSPNEKSSARLALRPCGWKLQNQLWESRGMTSNSWPVEVTAGMLSNVTTTRFNYESIIPRVVSAFQRDWRSYTLALMVALSPIPLALFSRSFLSFYVIPSASMEPTLLKGDVLLAEKFPGVYSRTKRGDVVLFQPPQTLRDIVTSNGSALSSTSLFVKRVVALPGDGDIRVVDNNVVLIDGKGAVGPNRNLCADEPLRLIDKLVENGKGRQIERLGEDEVYVLGDCKAVSVDSRVFGTLEKSNIIGRPVARIWPLNRFKISAF